MKDIINQLITDSIKQPIPTTLERDIVIPSFPSSIRKAISFIGMRRTGKTWIQYSHINNLLANNVAREQILYLNFEDDRLLNIAPNDLQYILDCYYSNFPNMINSDNVYFFFDEIHEVPNWEKFIRRLLDQERMQIFITGSSAKMLSKEIATNLRGRTLNFEIFPFSFKEFLKYKLPDLTKPFSSKDKAMVDHFLAQYIDVGGFPEIFFASPILHRQILQNYVETVIYRDVAERYNIRNIQLLKMLILLCFQNAATLFSINKIYNKLKSAGFKISKDTIYEYMEYLSDCYAIFQLSQFIFSGINKTLAPKKIYPIDTGLISSYSIKPEFDRAVKLETIVFLHLRRKFTNIAYYNCSNGKEVDFIVTLPNGKISLYQASLTLFDSDTKEREVSALKQAMQELKVNESTIITLDDSSLPIDTSHGVIHLINLRDFLLE